jgi:tripartite-type tricarboxylate transporter receptor subunit TctC
MVIIRLIKAVTAVGTLLFTSPGSAQSNENSYHIRNVNLIISTGVGGGYDHYGRLLMKYLPKHLPGSPAATVQFMPGAGGAVAANHLFNVAPRDGSTIGLISPLAPAFQILQGGKNYDTSKFHYIGRAASIQFVSMVWQPSGLTTLDSMKDKEILFGSTGPSQTMHMIPIALKNLLGLKARIVAGYKGIPELSFAMERGEITGITRDWSGWLSQHKDWIDNNKIVPVLQSGGKRLRELPNVPLLIEIARNSEERAVLELISSDAIIGRSFMMPPGVPQERVISMRRAFDLAIIDNDLLTDAKKLGLEIDPMSGEAIQELVNKIIATPIHIVNKAREVLEIK